MVGKSGDEDLLINSICSLINLLKMKSAYKLKHQDLVSSTIFFLENTIFKTFSVPNNFTFNESHLDEIISLLDTIICRNTDHQLCIDNMLNFIRDSKIKIIRSQKIRGII